jgi:hypothetical protein
VQLYKFKALVALDLPAGGSRDPLPVGRSRRMAVRGRHRQTRNMTFFSAMVTNNGPRSRRWKERHALLTVVITGDDAPEYFGIGNSLGVRLGGDIGHGIVTRSLSPWPAPG